MYAVIRRRVVAQREKARENKRESESSWRRPRRPPVRSPCACPTSQSHQKQKTLNSSSRGWALLLRSCSRGWAASASASALGRRRCLFRRAATISSAVSCRALHCAALHCRHSYRLAAHTTHCWINTLRFPFLTHTPTLHLYLHPWFLPCSPK